MRESDLAGAFFEAVGKFTVMAIAILGTICLLLWAFN